MVHSVLVRISIKCLAVFLRVLGFFQSFSAEWVKTAGHLGEEKKKESETSSKLNETKSQVKVYQGSLVTGTMNHCCCC